MMVILAIKVNLILLDEVDESSRGIQVSQVETYDVQKLTEGFHLNQ